MTFRFAVQIGRIVREDGSQGPEHFDLVHVIKGDPGGTSFDVAKDGALRTLRRCEGWLEGYPDELRRTRQLIAKVEGLDEDAATRLPDGRNEL